MGRNDSYSLLDILQKSVGYDIVLLTTYNFDIRLFEQAILNSLFANNVRKVSVYVDAEELTKSLQSVRTCQIGRKYMINPIRINSTFHPKVVLLLGEKKARLILSSANITTPGYISITSNEDAAQAELQKLFLPIKKGIVGVGSCCYTTSWSYHVAKRKHALKIPVSWLEANIAAYIKALSACGIYTGSCCDGNHFNTDILYIEFCYPYIDIHKAMWEFHLNSLFKLNWNDRYDSIALRKNKNEQYIELYHAASYIYQHRNSFIYARLEASKWMKKNALKHLSNEDIQKRFLYEFAITIRKVFPCEIKTNYY